MEKSIVFLLAFIFTFISCLREVPVEIEPGSEKSRLDTVHTYVTDWEFKLTPLNQNEFLLSTKEDVFDSNAELLLLNAWNPRDTFVFKAESEKNYYGGNDFNVNYVFDERNSYVLMVRHKKVDGNTVFIRDYFLQGGYKHTYTDKFRSQKIASANHILDFDITPSRDFIYFIDYVNNVPILHRLSLKDEKTDVIEQNFHIDVRAASDDDLIVFSRADINGRYLGGDSCTILNYNIRSKEKTFIAWGSADYGYFSRVIDNSILVTGPKSAVDKSILINLSDRTARSYPIDFRYIHENSFDHIYHGISIMNTETREFETPLPFLNGQSGIVYSDDKSGYYIVREGFLANQGSKGLDFYSRLLIYKDQKVVFELPFIKNRQINVPKLINLEDGKLIIHQQFGFSNKINYDGYYLIDIEKGDVSLLKNDTYFYNHYDFFLTEDKKIFYSIRTNNSDAAIYKMSLTE